MVEKTQKKRALIARKTKAKTSIRSFSKLTVKYQATIPKAIREHLDLKSGDQVLYELLPDHTVRIRKTSPLDLEYLRALESTMNEWESDEDESAYKNL